MTSPPRRAPLPAGDPRIAGHPGAQAGRADAPLAAAESIAVEYARGAGIEGDDKAVLANPRDEPRDAAKGTREYAVAIIGRPVVPASRSIVDGRLVVEPQAALRGRRRRSSGGANDRDMAVGPRECRGALRDVRIECSAGAPALRPRGAASFPDLAQAVCADYEMIEPSRNLAERLVLKAGAPAWLYASPTFRVAAHGGKGAAGATLPLRRGVRGLERQAALTTWRSRSGYWVEFVKGGDYGGGRPTWPVRPERRVRVSGATARGSTRPAEGPPGPLEERRVPLPAGSDESVRRARVSTGTLASIPARDPGRPRPSAHLAAAALLHRRRRHQVSTLTGWQVACFRSAIRRSRSAMARARRNWTGARRSRGPRLRGHRAPLRGNKPTRRTRSSCSRRRPSACCSWAPGCSGRCRRDLFFPSGARAGPDPALRGAGPPRATATNRPGQHPRALEQRHLGLSPSSARFGSPPARPDREPARATVAGNLIAFCRARRRPRLRHPPAPRLGDRRLPRRLPDRARLRLPHRSVRSVTALGPLSPLPSRAEPHLGLARPRRDAGPARAHRRPVILTATVTHVVGEGASDVVS